MPVENYKPLKCGSFGFLALLAAVDAPKKKRGGARANTGGARPGAGRPAGSKNKSPAKGKPRKPKFCKSCNAEFSNRGHFCEEHKSSNCKHEKPLFSNGKARQACYECNPKPEKKQRKSYEFKDKTNASCICCGAAFMKSTYHNRYCSAACCEKHCNLEAGKRRGDRSERACRSCGVFFAPEYGVKNKFNCSQECLKKYRADLRQAGINKKMSSDPVYKFARNVRTFLHQSFARTGNKKSERTAEILGCSIDFFRLHIERQFHRGMSWDARSDWHLDHIRPVSMAKSIDDVIELNHFTNLRPMWATENMSKGAKQTHLI